MIKLGFNLAFSIKKEVNKIINNSDLSSKLDKIYNNLNKDVLNNGIYLFIFLSISVKFQSKYLFYTYLTHLKDYLLF
jgi:hypothetical protein